MRYFFYLIALWLPLAALSWPGKSDPGLQKTLRELDDALDRQAEYDQMKLSTIAQLRQS